MEARASESDGGFEEFGADARVRADSVSHLVHIGAGRLTNGRHGVDGGDSRGVRVYVRGFHISPSENVLIMSTPVINMSL